MSLLKRLFSKKDNIFLQEKLNRFQTISNEIDKNLSPIQNIIWYFYEYGLRKKIDEISSINIKSNCERILDLLNDQFKLHKDIKLIYEQNPKAYKKDIIKWKF